MGFIAKQPNGLFCFFDDIDDQPKKWNISKEEYVDMCIKNEEETNLIICQPIGNSWPTDGRKVQLMPSVDFSYFSCNL